MKVLVRRDAYFDSVVLMLLSRELKGRPGVKEAVVAMGTPMNLGLLASMGCAAADLAGATPNDLVIAVDGADAATMTATMAAAEASLTRKKGSSGGAGHTAPDPATLQGALERLPGANLAVISIPGAYAAREARRALDAGLHVMLFSDNVALEDEIALKTHARAKGLLVMGPDCGSAIINGKPLCFANVVRRGPVGVVAASGTGLQEVTVLVDRAGSGVSQAIGTGGRDLKNAQVGGITMLMGIDALAQDDATLVIVVVSKPPAPAVAAKVIAALEAAGKSAVVHFIGLAPAPETTPAKPATPAAAAGPATPATAAAAATGASSCVRYAANLEEAAGMAVAIAAGRTWEPRVFAQPDADVAAIVARETAGMAGTQRFIRGYFTGGTLADEAWLALHALTGAVWSNNQTDPAFVLADPKRSLGHTVVDLGDDVFTVGRPHPMIDPSTRTERIDAEAGDDSIAVMLVDVVLGFGSHADPAGALVPSLVAAKHAAQMRGGRLAVVASITGTPGDTQGYAHQRATLERAGVLVMPSNYQATMLAVRIMEKVVANAGGAR